ncbi:peroxisomal membrane protein pex14 [Exophiala xenobiotica]|uniref:Peroxisomal membrane protein PEX14 n=1 Tax=Vermiconidia calcicola TaxID=1690605 RepID=A0AAV9Q2S8_9PEZI|nr:peroxisomal membrane protein pex14 [Exophiala xenobiotica]KAK5531861.1 peroxisomal membrane protein pex14 [Vermiconidia calcicola]KAK5537310.1 peroxisomal membrane protein pex14 [Chaetothyriales sp. CCFEE 6169]KAK5269431.1 peroxisomal membrane protein pex14 [Exophiala xenobiotica]KAK5287124.1 peroxisomal membrane protein pex14 [Exophiala xenobiotica]
MAPREDLITSAVTFLQDPSVASAALEKRIEFLKSKNLTQEEIDLSLARASSDPTSSQPSFQNAPFYPPAQQGPVRGPPSQRYPYPYNPYGDQYQFPPAPPPEPPRRDWRDWFIMATVVSGASYGLYVLTQRYIKPLIAPPTPAQLEQDKAAIDEQFNKAFALLDTLSSDTAALKEAEEQRTQRLDTAIADIETVVAELKAANMRRELDTSRLDADLRAMKDSLPRSIDNVRDASEKQLKELSNELGSLKLLLGNRMGAGSSSLTQGISRTQPGVLPASSLNSANANANAPVGTPSSSSTEATAPNPLRSTPSFSSPANQFSSSTTVPAATTTSRPASAAAFGNSGFANKAAIPAWQMHAAANNTKENMKEINFEPARPGMQTTNGSAPAQQQPDGAEAVAALNAT